MRHKWRKPQPRQIVPVVCSCWGDRYYESSVFSRWCCWGRCGINITGWILLGAWKASCYVCSVPATEEVYKAPKPIVSAWQMTDNGQVYCGCCHSPPAKYLVGSSSWKFPRFVQTLEKNWGGPCSAGTTEIFLPLPSVPSMEEKGSRKVAALLCFAPFLQEVGMACSCFS